MVLYVLGWGIWGVLCSFTALWSYVCYSYTKSGAGVSKGTVYTTIVWWLLLAWTLLHPGMNKLHLAWMAPVAVPLGLFAGLALPGGVLLLLAAYMGVLWWLTP